MHVERLKHLITILAAVPPERLDLGAWECGATACAVGWAARDPQFQADGLSLQASSSMPSPHLDYRDGSAPLRSWAAVEAFFGLTPHESLHLFSSGGYEGVATPADVIRRIDELLLEVEP